VDLIRLCYENEVDLLAHCNGDKAADNLLDALEEVQHGGLFRQKVRVIMVHAQTVREDQLARMQLLNVHPTFFSAHIYFWGDLHKELFLGPKRANRMNPAGSALKRNLKFTLHIDSPAALVGNLEGINTFLQTVEAAVTRQTKSGVTLDDRFLSQKIPVYEALKGITINAAWQARMEDHYGSISYGKIADLVILDRSPLEVEPDQISEIKVLTTIKKDKIKFGRYPKDSLFEDK
jgi:predicted amidohydrolase YtcJ